MGHRRRRHCYRRRLPVALIGLAGVLLAAGCTLGAALRPDTYTVRRGDTLYSIAQNYGLNWHKLARWNRIGPPYRIEIGQRLSLDPYPPLDYSPAGRNPSRAPRRSESRVARAPQDTRAEQQAAIQASTPRLTRTIEHGSPGHAQPPRSAHRGQPESRRAAQPAPAPADAKPSHTVVHEPKEPAHPAGPSEDGWQWPASGTIVRSYGPGRTRQGIDIGGRSGSPVYAASSGTVVYNGTGLKGYGQLIIIKHDDHYLSAYGFTQRSRVNKGRNVAAGAHIADMGLGPQNKPLLHFEIRRDGTPIDPESVLPKH